MRNRCEVCESYRSPAELELKVRLVEVAFDARPVVLCVAHARIAQNSGVASFEELREFYGRGRRSHVSRRGRGAAPKPDERRHSPGRRQSDAKRVA